MATMAEWHASDYHRQSGLQRAMADEQLGRLTLEGGERVLDVGCGDGTITAEIAARFPRGSALGVDPSPDMIAFASSRYGPPDHANLRFEVADARQLPYRDEFDLVVSFNALHWVPEQDAALGSIRSALKPQGRALLRFVPAGPRESLEDVIEEVRQRPRWAGYFADFRRPFVHFTPNEYRALSERAGFRVARLHVEDKAWDFGTREAFVAFSRATCVEWTQRLPEADWDAFITDVLDCYRAVAATGTQDANTFKFYQMHVELMPVPRVWLVTEFNSYRPKLNQWTVWISGRPLDPDKYLAEDVARKLIGPVPCAEADQVVAVLRDQLQAAGVQVFEDSAADD